LLQAVVVAVHAMQEVVAVQEVCFQELALLLLELHTQLL
jgi:hypothetical protein